MGEIYENWPAFVYIALTIGFSICFLRERRAETQALREIGANLHDRLGRMEQALRGETAKGTQGLECVPR